MRPTLSVPAEVWNATLGVFGDFAKARVEGGLFWYGHRADSPWLVTAIGVPRQENGPWNFTIRADALAELSAAVPEDLEVLAQLHGHPSIDTHMSDWDKAVVVSRRIVSIVLPFWGGGSFSLAALGVHVFEEGSWLRLEVEDAAETMGIRSGYERDDRPLIIDRR